MPVLVEQHHVADVRRRPEEKLRQIRIVPQLVGDLYTVEHVTEAEQRGDDRREFLRQCVVAPVAQVSKKSFGLKIGLRFC